MAAQFLPLVVDAGVDTHPPSMIIPRGGWNIVGLVGAQTLRVVANNKSIQIQELSWESINDSKSLIAQKAGKGRVTSALVSLATRTPSVNRFFKISGNIRLGKAGAAVHAMNPRSKRPEATLRVVVLDERRVKLAIRPVQSRDENGSLAYHSKLPFNAEQLCADMNEVWTPQSNIIFELVSKQPAVVDDKAAIAKADEYGKHVVPRQIDPIRFAPIFRSLISPNADFTIFRVKDIGRQRILKKDGETYAPIEELGHAFSKDRFALVGDEGLTPTAKLDPLTRKPKINTRRVMPHEAGHWLGDPDEKRAPHFIVDNDQLMATGTNGVHVSVADTLAFFNTNY